MGDFRRNFGYGAVTEAPTPAKNLAVNEVAKFRIPKALAEVLKSNGGGVPFNADVWAAGEIPLSSNAEIVRVTGIGPLETNTLLTVERQTSTEPNNYSRTITVGDQFMAGVTAKDEPLPSETAKAYVAPNGNDARSGGSAINAKLTVQPAIEALPVGPEGGRYGTVECLGGIIEAKSTGRYEPAVAFKAANIIECPGATAADKGAYVVAGPGTKGEACVGVQEGNHISAVLEGTWNGTTKKVEAGGTTKFIEVWGGPVFEKAANKEGKGGSKLKSLWVVKPAIELPVGVQLIGQGRMSGYNDEAGTPVLGLSVQGGTILEDTGTGITIMVESGTGEKPTETLAGGGVVRDMTVRGNPENLFGFAVAGNFGTKLERVSFIGHGYWGARIGNRAVVAMELRDCEFRENGLHGLFNNGGPERSPVYAWQPTGGPQEYGKIRIETKTAAELHGTTTLTKVASYVGVEKGTKVTGTGIPAATTVSVTPSEAEEEAGELKLSAAATETGVERELTFVREAKFKPQYNVGERVEEGGHIYECLKTGSAHKPSEEGLWWRKVTNPLMESGGLALTKAPNSGRAYNMRILGNYGVGLEICGSSVWGGECSKTSIVSGVKAVGEAWGGIGLTTEGSTASGGLGINSVWFENNERVAVEGAGGFYTCTFQGHGVEEYAINMAGANGPLTCTDCKFFNDITKTSIKQSSANPIALINCETAGTNKDTNAVELQSKALVSWATVESEIIYKHS